MSALNYDVHMSKGIYVTLRHAAVHVQMHPLSIQNIQICVCT